MNILTTNDTFCWCGLLAIVEYNGKNRCKTHIGKDPKQKIKTKNFRGHSDYQLEQGYFNGKEGSNA